MSRDRDCPGGQPEAEAPRISQCREGARWQVAGAGRAPWAVVAAGAAAWERPASFWVLAGPRQSRPRPRESGLKTEAASPGLTQVWKEAGPLSAGPCRQEDSFPDRFRPPRPSGLTARGPEQAPSVLEIVSECLQSVCARPCLVCECAPAERVSTAGAGAGAGMALPRGLYKR